MKVSLLCFFRAFDDATPRPAFFVKRIELDTGGMFADTPLDFREQFALMRVTEFSKEGTELDTL